MNKIADTILNKTADIIMNKIADITRNKIADIIRTHFTIIALATFCIIIPAGCTISYGFTSIGGLDYNKVKTVSFDKFPIRSTYVWAPMEAMFYNSLVDEFSSKTKLKVQKRNGDLDLQGEIVEYSQTNKSVAADGFSAQTQLKITVNVRFTNNTKHEEDFEQKFSATTVYDSSQSLASVQEELVQEMIDDIIDQIFNATVANW